MELAAASALVEGNLDYRSGMFYGSPADLPLGRGLIFTQVRQPIYDVEQHLFMTVEEPVYILTHECDVDPANQRTFRSYLLVCPIIRFEDWLAAYSEDHSDDELGAFLGNLATRRVSRVFYLPPLPPLLGYGGLLYFNQITHTHVSAVSFEGGNCVAAVTEYGLTKIDHMLENHVLRPKAQVLSMARW
ncbi:MAG TPA: hypothetical protein VJQ52_01280 [Steroidobacteraceae bacterium]|nr:hypothetical protein [Steroidobacteraceae bacterium]